MGGGSWSYDDYSVKEAARKASGKSAFDYSDKVRTGAVARKAYKDLDTKGVMFRESCDSTEHPNSTAIAVIFDVTGSMQGVPPLLQQKLPALFGLLVRKGFVPDPQVMMGAITDGYSETIVLQAGQFESDNRIDENLAKIVLEGGGGGGNHESYELALYFMARHTKIDCFDKHGRKGYLFLIGDERSYTEVNFRQVEQLMGDKLEANIPLVDIMNEVKKRYNVFFLHPMDASYVDNPDNVAFWTKLLGQNYIEHVQTDTICETIAGLIGASEGTVSSVDDITSALTEVGTSSAKARAVGNTVSPFIKAKASAVVSSGTRRL